MPCSPPSIIDSLDECCFTCYTEGRSPYQAPLAIVLHEYDGHIEELNNEMQSCCNLKQDCHSSFHYGVGDGGQVYKFVDVEDTAWSFHPIMSDANCGLCDWNFGATQGAQHPNKYTINIAVATGTSGIKSGRRWPNNVFGTSQFDALVQLVGWLADTYNITINQNMIWRHCDELWDFPDLCGGCTFADFLQTVQDCIDTVPVCLPDICDDFCNCDVTTGMPTFIFGADDNCDTCGRYELDLCTMIQSLNAGTFDKLLFVGLDDQSECIAMEVDPSCNTTEVASSALGVNSNGVPGFYQTRQRLTHRDAAAIDTLLPATDRIINCDAENESVIFNLTEPGPCDPQDFWIKRMDCNQNNTVAINGVVGDIDGESTIFLNTPGPKGSRGEAIHVYWNGSEWEII